ncbi:MAG: nucleotidyltransferase substrate binding protein [Cetobacterium sp.]
MGKRWSERINDLNNAISRLDEAVKDSIEIPLSTVKDGVIQRFEFSLELSWKLLKIYLTNEGLENFTTPKSVVREAFKVGMIKNCDLWIEMIEDRNLTSHIYSQSIADNIYSRIVNKYLKELQSILEILKRAEV